VLRRTANLCRKFAASVASLLLAPSVERRDARSQRLMLDVDAIRDDVAISASDKQLRWRV